MKGIYKITREIVDCSSLSMYAYAKLERTINRLYNCQSFDSVCFVCERFREIMWDLEPLFKPQQFDFFMKKINGYEVSVLMRLTSIDKVVK